MALSTSLLALRAYLAMGNESPMNFPASAESRAEQAGYNRNGTFHMPVGSIGGERLPLVGVYPQISAHETSRTLPTEIERGRGKVAPRESQPG
jgi:hypothetical protein